MLVLIAEREILYAAAQCRAPIIMMVTIKLAIRSGQGGIITLLHPSRLSIQLQLPTRLHRTRLNSALYRRLLKDSAAVNGQAKPRSTKTVPPFKGGSNGNEEGSRSGSDSSLSINGNAGDSAACNRSTGSLLSDSRVRAILFMNGLYSVRNYKFYVDFFVQRALCLASNARRLVITTGSPLCVVPLRRVLLW